MAEKRVSVRLAAVGGRQVRAELEGVGEAGMIFGRPFCLRTLSGTKIWMDSSGFIIPPPPSFVAPHVAHEATST